MALLSYVNVFTSDIDKLAEFYSSLFALEEIAESRSPMFRGFQAGDCSIGFSGEAAYELLGMQPLTADGDRVFVTFDVESEDEVKELTAKAASLGANVVKVPFATYYGWFQSVLRDPDGNAFRINFRGLPA